MRMIRASLLLAACACAPGPGSIDAIDAIDSIAQALPPVTHGAALLDHTIPPAMSPGERLNVRVRMTNTGATSPGDDWTAGYSLYSRNSPLTRYLWVNDPLLVATPGAGGVGVFDFVITAPAAGAGQSFAARMFMSGPGGGFFGSPFTVAGIEVSPATQRRWACTYLESTLPASMIPGELRSVTVTVRNSGTATWPASGLSLYSRDNTGSPAAFGKWGATSVPIGAPVDPGQAVTIGPFQIQAPQTEQTHTFLRQIFDSNPPSPAGGVGLFDTSTPCVDLSVVVATPVSPLNGARLIAHTLPATMRSGETRQVSVTLENTGAAAWTTDGAFLLYSQSSPRNLWNVVSLRPQLTPSGARATFVYNIQAPSAGSYAHRWRMDKTQSPEAGYFGDLVDVPVEVADDAPLALDAEVAGQVIPGTAAPGAIVGFQVTMTNTGESAWTGPSFKLGSANSPPGLWGTTELSLGAAETVAPGESRIFTFNVIAPAAGLHASRWQMRQAGGVGPFGAIALTSDILVTRCGDGLVGGGETCEDGNTLEGDGCSSRCLVEPREVTLSSTTGRGFLGARRGAQLGNVVIGDVTGDGVAEVVVGESISTAITADRVFAGVVVAYSGGAGFFDGTTSTVPSGERFEIRGADYRDRLGGGFPGGLAIADVTGDGTPDLIVSAAYADGLDELRTDCGEIYVIQGGPALAGIVDLRASPLPALVRARIIGPTRSGAGHVLATGDLDGDGTADLLIGVPGDAPNGRNHAGAAYVVRGGTALPAVLDLADGLADPAVLAIYQGAVAEDELGYAGAIGDFGGSADNDVVLGAQLHDPFGIENGGAAWGIFGPALGARDLGGAGFDVQWLGFDLGGGVGHTVKVGNVRGDGRAEAIISGSQLRNPGVIGTEEDRKRGAVDIWTGPVAAGTHDYGMVASGTRIFGADPGDVAGQSIALGDLNGDGMLDLVILSSAADGPGNAVPGAGEAAVVLGAVGLPDQLDLGAPGIALRIHGPRPSGLLGHYPNTVAVGRIDPGDDADLCLGAFNGAAGSVDCLRSRW